MSVTGKPATIGPYKRYMIEMFDDRSLIEEGTVFQSFFGRNGGQTVVTDSLNVEFDIKRGNEKVAKMVKRGMPVRFLGDNFKNLDTEQYTEQTLKFGLIKEELDLTSDQTFTRVFGSSAYSDTDRAATLRLLARDGNMEMVRRIVRKDEVLAAQSILLGTQEVLEATTDADWKYDFQRNALLTSAAPNAWNSGSQDIAKDFDDSGELLRKYGKVRGSAALLGGGAMDALIRDSEMQSTADIRRYELLEIGDKPVPSEYQWLIDGGATAYGRFKSNKGFVWWLFTYNEYYENDAGTFFKYMPDDKVLFFSNRARTDRYFGPTDILPIPGQKDQLMQQMLGFGSTTAPMPPGVMNAGSVVLPASFNFDMYLNDQHTTLTLRVEQAPIYNPIQTDAYRVLTGVV
jgi:hypothetical protein